ncbi:hypothetical protein L207DRAFT_12482 [Hyaloscypha variabilis F]|uniref:Uncharacterized protein n=1 Tax=Hyaloscypha variabilis (strain UAMH 11265 / GT02V1 / F) TaxID=1149755 RepID=A0A2J6SD07_HYAVF|nr:hypothetical protein L207DRAFT_12482 [Hyaloscypha variabilis F]
MEGWLGMPPRSHTCTHPMLPNISWSHQCDPRASSREVNGRINGHARPLKVESRKAGPQPHRADSLPPSLAISLVLSPMLAAQASMIAVVRGPACQSSARSTSWQQLLGWARSTRTQPAIGIVPR